MTTYRTVQGDTWDIIAKKLDWPETYLHFLMKANPDHQAIFFFPAGIELVVPDVDEPTEEIKRPPWQRTE